MNPKGFHEIDFVSLLVSVESQSVCNGVSTDRESYNARARVSGPTANHNVPNVSPTNSTITLDSDEHRESPQSTRNQSESHGLHPVRVEGDGRCSFRCIVASNDREINMGELQTKFSDCSREHETKSCVRKQSSQLLRT